MDLKKGRGIEKTKKDAVKVRRLVPKNAIKEEKEKDD